MIYAIAAVLVLILDQAAKFWTTKNIVLSAVGDDCIEIIPGIIHMTNVHNTGAAFSILQNARWLLVVVTLIFVITIIILINREVIHTGFGRWMAVLVMAGAVGNCIDRALYGYVVDMFEFEFFTFPVFNVADIFITVCGILFCIHLVLYREPEAVKRANETSLGRRMREKRQQKLDDKAAKEAPYAKIPHRGEHKTLEEELRSIDPDDPFAEWTFGAEVKVSEEKDGENPEDAPPERADDEEAFERRFSARYGRASDDKGEGRSEPEPEPEPERKPEPEPEPEPERKPEPKPERKRRPEPEPGAGSEAKPRTRTKPKREPEPRHRRDDFVFDDEDEPEDDDYFYDAELDRDNYDPAGDFDFGFDAAPKSPEKPGKTPEKNADRPKADDISAELADIFSEFGDF